MESGTLEDILLFSNGKSIKPGGEGAYPAFGANGVIGRTDDFNYEDAIILGRVGAYCGAVERCEGKFWASDNTIVVKPKIAEHNKSYIYYLLKRLELNKYAGGAAQPLLTQTVLKQVPISYHDSQEQKEIGEILESYDLLIENNSSRISILETIAQNLYREWFISFRFPNHTQTQWQDTPQGKIPAGWEVKLVKDFGEVVTGKTPSKKKEENYDSRDVQFIKTPDMHAGMYVTETTEMLSQVGANSQKNKFLPIGSIMVSCIGTAGIVAINTEPAQTNQQINTVVLNGEYQREFLYFSLLGLKQTILNHGSTGANVINLSASPALHDLPADFTAA